MRFAVGLTDSNFGMGYVGMIEMTEAEPDSPEVPDFDSYDRAEVADDLRESIDEALSKFAAGRIYDAENERVRIKYLRAAVAASTEYRQQVGEIEAEAQQRRIQRLEEAVEELRQIEAEADE